LVKSTHHSWRYERKCEWAFFSEHSVLIGGWVSYTALYVITSLAVANGRMAMAANYRFMGLTSQRGGDVLVDVVDEYINFYPRDAMLAWVIGIATSLSVCLTRAGIVSKRRKIAS